MNQTRVPDANGALLGPGADIGTSFNLHPFCGDMSGKRAPMDPPGDPCFRAEGSPWTDMAAHFVTPSSSDLYPAAAKKLLGIVPHIAQVRCARGDDEVHTRPLMTQLREPNATTNKFQACLPSCNELGSPTSTATLCPSLPAAWGSLPPSMRSSSSTGPRRPVFFPSAEARATDRQRRFSNRK